MLEAPNAWVRVDEAEDVHFERLKRSPSPHGEYLHECAETARLQGQGADEKENALRYLLEGWVLVRMISERIDDKKYLTIN